MNPKQKKFLLIAGIALAAVYFAPTLMNSVRTAVYMRQMEAAAGMAKPPGGKTAIPLPAPGSG
jgi:hypothetical protein